MKKEDNFILDNKEVKAAEPAHQLEFVTKDVKSDRIFTWFTDHIQGLNDTATILCIGKGLEQSMDAAQGGREVLQANKN